MKCPVMLSKFIYKLNYFCIEFANLMEEGPSTACVELLKCCANLVISSHSNDVPPDHPRPIPNTYNPPKYGRAYYFTEHGCQIREMRKFSIDKDKKNENFDDTPDKECNKSFLEVAKRGTSFVFLWFCPRHGHCYGFHIIPASEGRKDPAASLYTHCKEAPKDVMYDFACSLSEYSHNGESGYFSKTRFFHDVFHGYTHKCSKAFRANRLLGFGSVNSSICEQFNSFIQNIKTSARLMSQSHFCFYLQFFIHIGNKKKRLSFKKHTIIAKESDC